MQDFSKQLHAVRQQGTSTTQRDDWNAILRRIVAVWGEPMVVGYLFDMLGCHNVADSHDEFTSCYVQVPGTSLELNLNIFQRNVNAANPTGGKSSRHYEKDETSNNNPHDDDDDDDDENNDWTCYTCHVHQHPRWFASRVVVGTVTYTMVRPDCPRPEEDVTLLPTQDALLGLDKQQQHAYTATTVNGDSLLDRVGTRFTNGRSDTVWEITERMELRQGDTLLCSPMWYHRMIPAPANATHTGVTFVVKDHGDDLIQPHSPQQQSEPKNVYLLIPSQLHPQVPEYKNHRLACYKFHDVQKILTWHPLDREGYRELGMPVFPCDPDRLHDLDDNFMGTKYYQLPPNTTATGL